MDFFFFLPLVYRKNKRVAIATIILIVKKFVPPVSSRAVDVEVLMVVMLDFIAGPPPPL